MSGSDSPSHTAALPSWGKPTIIIVTVGLLAFTFWTLPNWGIFWRNVAHFPILWSLPANRRSILFLTIKVISPVIMMGLTSVALGIDALIRLPASEEETTQGDLQRVPNLHRVEVLARQHSSAPPSTPPAVPDASWLVRVRPSPASTVRRHDPETPLPLMFAVSEALKLHADDRYDSTVTDQVEQSTTLPSIDGSEGVSSTPAIALPPVMPPVVGGKANETAAPLLSIRLLQDVSVSINVPGGGSVPVPLTMQVKRVQLLAYLAWKRGTPIDRDTILEHVFGRGLSDEEATQDKLSERFESHKKLLRRKIREVIHEHINTPAGKQLIDPDLDPFVSSAGSWRLAPHCRVEDLDTIEGHFHVIATARKEGKLVDGVPAYVKAACDSLIASYPGDFLATLIKRYQSEFRPWQGRSSWVRKPFTLYRDYYLEALWYAAEYEWRIGHGVQRATNEMDDDAAHQPIERSQAQECFDRAAQLYQQYAMYCCNSRFDAKATFGAHGEIGERLRMSERALRRCVVLLGTLGKTESIDQVWTAYEAQMKRLTDSRWQPSQETLADLHAARAQTGAYRFDAPIWQRSKEFAP